MSPALDPRERHQIARIAALSRHAHTDGRDATASAREAFNVTRFENLVDPERLLPAVERARRATAARKAHFAQLALKSARARRNRALKDDS